MVAGRWVFNLGVSAQIAAASISVSATLLLGPGQVFLPPESTY